MIRVQCQELSPRLLIRVCYTSLVGSWGGNGEDLALLPFRFLESSELRSDCPHAG